MPVKSPDLQKLQQRVRRLERQVERLSASPGLTVPITTLAPEPFQLLQNVLVVVQEVEGDFIASFFDANINASGCTETEAVANLKDVMLSLFERLSSLPEAKLGPGPSRQLAVLKQFVRKKP